MADVYRIGVSIAMSNGVSPVLGTISRDLLGLDRSIARAGEGFGRMKLAALGAAGVLAGGGILSGMAKLIEHGGKLVDQQAQLKLLGISNVDLANATAAAWKTTGEVLGTSVTRNLELIREAKGAFGTIPDAIALAPDLAKADAVRSFVAGRQDDAGMQMVMKAIEMRGDIKYSAAGNLDLGAARTGLNAALKFLNASGGQVDPGTLKGLITQAGPMAKMMAPDAFYRTMLTATEELQQKAGTSLSAAGRALYGGIMPQRNVVEMERLGLINPKGVHVRRGGNVSVDQGSLTGFGVLNGPGGLAEWADKVLRPRLHTDYTKAAARTPGLSEGQFDQQEMYRLLPTETFRRLMGIFLQQSESVKKGAANYDQAKGLSGYSNVIDDSYTGKMNAFREAWSNLMTALGVPAVSSATNLLGKATSVLNEFGQWAAAHPETVGNIEKITGALAATAAIGGGLAIAGAAFDPFVSGLKNVVGIFASGGAAASATPVMGELAGALVRLGPTAPAGIALAALPVALATLATTVIGLPRALKGISDEIGSLIGDPSKYPEGHNTPRAIGPGAIGGHGLAPDAAKPSGWGILPDIGDAIGNWYRSQTQGPARVQKESYVPTGPMRAQNITLRVPLIVDGRQMAESVTQHQLSAWGGASSPGQTAFDGSMTPMPSGAALHT